MALWRFATHRQHLECEGVRDVFQSHTAHEKTTDRASVNVIVGVPGQTSSSV